MLRPPRYVWGIAFLAYMTGFAFVAAQSSINAPQNQTVSSSENGPTQGSKPDSDAKLALYTEVLAWFTGALVVVSAFQGFILIRAGQTARITAEAARDSANATIDAVKTARDSVRRELRAYIHIASAQVSYDRSNAAKCWVTITIKTMVKPQHSIRSLWLVSMFANGRCGLSCPRLLTI